MAGARALGGSRWWHIVPAAPSGSTGGALCFFALWHWQPSASTFKFLSTPARSGTFSCNDPVVRNCRICSGTLMSAEQTLLWNSALPCSIRLRLVRMSPQPPRHFVTAAGTPRSRPRPDLTRPPRCLTMSCHLRSSNSRFRSADGCRSTRTDTPSTCRCRNGR